MNRVRPSRHVRVKVCGLTRPDEARAAAEAGADAIGLVFWPASPRAVSLPEACRIVAALPPLVLRVGVFVDAPAAEIARLVRAVPLDLVQLHGSEQPELLPALGCRALKALAAGPGLDLEEARRWGAQASGVLLDARVAGAPGGSGRRCDWDVARQVRACVPWLLLAGGLDASNVEAALRRVDPDALDVSSGVESAPGRKDAARVREFVAAVRAAAEA